VAGRAAVVRSAAFRAGAVRTVLGMRHLLPYARVTADASLGGPVIRRRRRGDGTGLKSAGTVKRGHLLERSARAIVPVPFNHACLSPGDSCHFPGAAALIPVLPAATYSNGQVA